MSEEEMRGQTFHISVDWQWSTWGAMQLKGEPELVPGKITFG